MTNPGDMFILKINNINRTFLTIKTLYNDIIIKDITFDRRQNDSIIVLLSVLKQYEIVYGDCK